MVWRPSRQWSPVRILIGPAIALMMPILIVWKLLSSRSVSLTDLLGATFIFIVFAAILSNAIRQILRGRFVAITPTGVHGRTHWGEVSLPWADFVDARYEYFGVRIIGRGKLLPASIPYVFDNAHDIADFREAVACAAQRYASSR